MSRRVDMIASPLPGGAFVGISHDDDYPLNFTYLQEHP